MLELYHGLASTCSKKVRMCLAEKGVDWQSHLLNLQKFDQHDPEYLKLNPNGVVPTLVVDGRPITESSIIIAYIDDAFPDPPLSPASPFERAAMRHWLKWSDDVAYGAVFVATWNKLSRPVVSKLSDAELDAIVSRIPTRERAERWRHTAREGFSDDEFRAAEEKQDRTFARMADALAAAPWLTGAAFSLADIAIVPFVDRILDLRPEIVDGGRYAAVVDWYERMRARPSFTASFFFEGMDTSTGAVRETLKV